MTSRIIDSYVQLDYCRHGVMCGALYIRGHYSSASTVNYKLHMLDDISVLIAVLLSEVAQDLLSPSKHAGET